MKKLIKDCQNPKIKGYSLPDSWNSEKKTVISLNFSNANWESIEHSVKTQILECLYEDENTRSIKLVQYEKLAARQLLNDVCANSKNNIVLLIDEYDNPLNNNLFEEQIFTNLSKNFYFPFFSTVKSLIEQCKIKQCVTTGILKFSNVGIFSGFLVFFIV